MPPSRFLLAPAWAWLGLPPLSWGWLAKPFLGLWWLAGWAWHLAVWQPQWWVHGLGAAVLSVLWGMTPHGKPGSNRLARPAAVLGTM